MWVAAAVLLQAGCTSCYPADNIKAVKETGMRGNYDRSEIPIMHHGRACRLQAVNLRSMGHSISAVVTAMTLIIMYVLS